MELTVKKQDEGSEYPITLKISRVKKYFDSEKKEELIIDDKEETVIINSSQDAINNLNNVAMANTRSREIAEINKNDYFVMKKITRE